MSHMTVVGHDDTRVGSAFEARREALQGAEWQDIETAVTFPNERDWVRRNLSAVEYPAWYPLHPCVAYRVDMYGEGDFTGQAKSVMMRKIVRETLGLKQREFKWLMVRTGGRGRDFRHTWWIFTDDELDSAARLYA